MAKQEGRVPPNDIDAEKAVLGSVLLSNKILDELYGLITAEDFYSKANKSIWEGINRMRNEQPGVTIDLRSLTSFLKGAGLLQDCGGPGYLASLTSVIPVTGNAAYFAGIIRDCSLKRQLFELSVEVGEKAFDETEDVRQSIDRIDQKIAALSLNTSARGYSISGDFLFSLIDDIHARMDNRKSIGVSSGFGILDRYIGGFKPGEMIIIGARPSVGKTALALSLAHNIAFRSTNPVKVGFFSLEMSGQSLMERLLAREGLINYNILRNGKVTQDLDVRITEVASKMYDFSGNLLIQDTPDITLLQIRAQSRRMVISEGVGIIFIDYIGLINPEGVSLRKERYEQVSEISRALKSLARELQVPIVCLCQVSRDAGKDRGPILADLRDSGAIEQDADLVILLDDPSSRLDKDNKVARYSQSIDEADSDGSPAVNDRKIKVIIAKQRNGSTGGFDLLLRSNYVSFEEIEKRDF